MQAADPHAPLIANFRGCLLGLAVGDVVGLAREGLVPAPKLSQRNGEIGPYGNPRLGLSPGVPGAHTQLMMAVLDSYNTQGVFDPQEICERMLEAERQPLAAIDPMTKLALAQWADGWHFEPAAQLAAAQASPSQLLSGHALPRVVPPGLLHYHDDLHLIGESRVVAGLTHPAELTKICATSLCLALQHLLLAGTGSLLEELLVWLRPRNADVYEVLRLVPRLRPDRLDSSGSAIGVLQAALWVSLHASDFEEGLSLLARRGGKASLLCSVGGALLGARFGVVGIPEKWLERLTCRGTLDHMAQRLFFVSQQADLPLLLLQDTDLGERFRRRRAC